MFLFNMVALLVGAILIFIVVNKIEQEKKRKELLEYVKGKRIGENSHTIY